MIDATLCPDGVCVGRCECDDVPVADAREWMRAAISDDNLRDRNEAFAKQIAAMPVTETEAP